MDFLKDLKPYLPDEVQEVLNRFTIRPYKLDNTPCIPYVYVDSEGIVTLSWTYLLTKPPKGFNNTLRITWDPQDHDNLTLECVEFTARHKVELERLIKYGERVKNSDDYEPMDRNYLEKLHRLFEAFESGDWENIKEKSESALKIDQEADYEDLF